MMDEAQVIRRFKRMKLLVGTLVVVGLVLHTFGGPWMAAARGASPRTLALVHAGGLLFEALACVLYLRLKGRNGLFGLVGALGLLGVLCVFFMDKQCHRCGLRQKHDAPACGGCGWPV